MAIDVYNLAAQPERERLVGLLLQVRNCARTWRPKHRPLLGTVIVCKSELELQWLRSLLAGRFAEIADLVSLGMKVNR